MGWAWERVMKDSLREDVGAGRRDHAESYQLGYKVDLFPV